MALSQDFIEQIQTLLGSEAEALLQAISGTDASVSVRRNPLKTSTTALSHLQQVPWCAEGAYLNSRLPFTFDTDFQTGRYYVQDASSMFISHALRRLVDSPVRYLDLCAAPGGKTTAALASLPEGSLVVANEIVPTRAQILRENIIKWGYANAVVTNNRPADFARLGALFDVVAADVPCSGEGMMRKDPEAVAQWTPALVNECARRDIEIIGDAWQCLRPGGLLIYSTCTYNRLENECIVEHICNTYGAESIDLGTPADWRIAPGINCCHHCYRFMQHRIEGEGLFMCILRKPLDGSQPAAPAKRVKPAKKAAPAVPPQAKTWLLPPDEYAISADATGTVTAIHHAFAPLMPVLANSLRVLHQGITLGAIKGKSLVPSHALALSTQLNAHAFASAEVTYAQAIAYMRGEAITLTDAPRGYVLLTHQGAPIGFVNNLGNRANNLYPKEWRIRSTHAPEQKPDILK